MNFEYEAVNNHLDKADTSFIDVYDYEAKKYVNKKLGIDQIKEQFGSLDGYLESLINKGISVLQFYLRRKNGSGSQLAGPNSVLIMRLGKKDEIKEESKEAIQEKLNFPSISQNQPDMQNLAQSQSHPLNNAYQQQPANQDYYLRQQLLDQKEKFTDKIDDLKEKVVDLKEDRDNYKRKYNKTREEKDELKSQVLLAARDKELALREAKQATQGFLDSEGGQALLTEGLGVVQQALNRTKDATQTNYLASPSQNPKLSDTKRALIMALEQQGISDDICEALYFTLVGLTSNEDFIKEHTILLDLHNLKKQS
ncbi:hypothetical protein [Lacinutrix sp. Hel_I_90]|uniref:hypothetical protein n=1 Tax=Lacinutrix sp. Hel_I_90 TaxID=1249999 RepID=UPI0005C94EF0|nr:hypothetical protein [Lacinutrix sp. Hel_I_90]